MSFTLSAPDSVTAVTTSWDRPATYCTTCGFDPVLWLFNTDTGALINHNDDIEIIANHLANPTNDPANPAGTYNLNAKIVIPSLAAGRYICWWLPPSTSAT
jgi:hypothetical protein